MYYYPKDRQASIEWRNSRIVFYLIMGALISTTLVYAVVMTTFGHQSHAVVIFAYFLGTFFMTVRYSYVGVYPVSYVRVQLLLSLSSFCFTLHLGYFACTVALFQYLPQIYKTWRTQSIGSLSIVSMCIQTPGALLIVYTQIQQPHSDYTTWLPTFAAAVLQGILLMMCLFLQYYCPRSSHPLEEMASFDDYDNGKNSETSAFEGKLPLVSNIDSQKSSSSELNAASTEDPYKLEVKPLIRSHK